MNRVLRCAPGLSAALVDRGAAPDACFIVRDHSGQALAYVYLESLRLFREEERAAGAERPKLLRRDEAQRIAANIAKLPELLSGR